MKRTFIILLATVMLLCLTTTSFASNDISNQAVSSNKQSYNEKLLPKLDDIKIKSHYNKISTLKSQDQVDKYLSGLTTNELLAAIAETSEELQKTDDFYSLVPFTAHSEKIITDLTVDDYVYILGNKDYSTYFKYYILDIVEGYSKFKKQSMQSFSKNSTSVEADKKYSNSLRSILKDNKADSSLQVKAMYCIHDYAKNDIPMLTNILDSTNYSSLIKGHALESLKGLDSDMTLERVEKIIKSPLNYSKFELQQAMKLMDDIKNDSDIAVSAVENVLTSLKNTSALDDDTINEALWSLGKIKNKKSVTAVINNKDLFGEDLVGLYVNMNFNTINQMLNINESQENLNAALACITIMPFKEFAASLNELQNKSNNKELSIKIASALKEMQKYNLTRNINWDDYN